MSLAKFGPVVVLYIGTAIFRYIYKVFLWHIYNTLLSVVLLIQKPEREGYPELVSTLGFATINQFTIILSLILLNLSLSSFAVCRCNSHLWAFFML